MKIKYVLKDSRGDDEIPIPHNQTIPVTVETVCLTSDGIEEELIVTFRLEDD